MRVFLLRFIIKLEFALSLSRFLYQSDTKSSLVAKQLWRQLLQPVGGKSTTIEDMADNDHNLACPDEVVIIDLLFNYIAYLLIYFDLVETLVVQACPYIRTIVNSVDCATIIENEER